MTGPADVVAALTVPASWVELDLGPGRAASAAALAADRVRDVPPLRVHEDALAALLREHADSAAESGAVYCAVMSDAVEGGVLSASVTVSVLPGPADSRPDDPDRLQHLLAPLGAQAGAEGTWHDVGLVELDGVGRAARTTGVEDVVVEPGRPPVRVVVMQTLVPVPGDRSVVVVSCSSPAVDLAEPLLDLFDAVTGTLELSVPA